MDIFYVQSIIQAFYSTFARRDTMDIRVDPEDIFSFPENNIVLNRTEGDGDMDSGLGRDLCMY